MKVIEARKLTKKIEKDIKQECRASGIELTYDVEQTMCIALEWFEHYLIELK